MSATEQQRESGSGPIDDTLSENFGRVGVNDQGDPDVPPKTEEEYAQSMLTLRAIVSSKEAGVIIGKAGKNVADLRDETGVKAGVSKVVQGVHDRVLTVTGPLQGTSKAYAIVAKSLLEGAPQIGMGGVVPNNGTHCTYLLFAQFTHPCGLRMLSFERILRSNFFLSSCPTPHLTQPDGHYHWTTRPEDQVHSGCFRSPNGGAKRNASPIH